MTEEEHNMSDYEETCAGFSVEVPEYYNFGYDVIDTWAEKDPAHPAMLRVDQQGHEETFTFRDLADLSTQAAVLLAAYGIQKGDRIAILLPRVSEWWIFCLACIRLGAVFSPCTTMLTPGDLEYRINTAEIKAVITDRENADKIDGIREDCPTLRLRCLTNGERPGWISYQKEKGLHPPARRKNQHKTRSDDPMVIYFTSGTTGKPKMVLHTHALAPGHITTGEFWLDLRRDDLHFTLSDTGWAKSSYGNLFGPWLMGACIFIYDIRGKFRPAEIPPVLEKYKVTTFCAPPTAYRMLVHEMLKNYNYSRLRYCTSAGEPLNPEAMRIWKEATGLDIHEGYGQTETSICIASFPCFEVRAGSMGKPAPGWQIELHDNDGTPVGVREEGRIAIGLNPRPVGLFTEYPENPKANRAAFVSGWYYIGDMAYKDEGGCYWFVGREDDVITSLGYRIGPFEVESALLEHPAVRESAVVGLPDETRGELVSAFVVLSPGLKPSDALTGELQEHVKQTTAPYKYPRRVEFVDSLPKTISGKIRRHLLREQWSHS